jgi:hypothetical protein
MIRGDGMQAEDRGRTETPAGIQAVGSDKAAVLEKAVVTDGKIKKTGSRGPGFSMINKKLMISSFFQ